MEEKHTPIPWRLAEQGLGQNAGIFPANATGPCIADCNYGNPAETLANAQFIVCACNVHDDLLAALEYVSLMLGDFTPDGLKGLGFDVALEKVDAAILKAKGAPC